MKPDVTLSVSLRFEEVSLPPFRDILVLGKKCPSGKVCVSKCLSLLSPDSFELLELEDSVVEAVLVSKRILKRMQSRSIIQILKERVFPYITKGEIVKVDFTVVVSCNNIDVNME